MKLAVSCVFAAKLLWVKGWTCGDGTSLAIFPCSQVSSTSIGSCSNGTFPMADASIIQNT